MLSVTLVLLTCVTDLYIYFLKRTFIFLKKGKSNNFDRHFSQYFLIETINLGIYSDLSQFYAFCFLLFDVNPITMVQYGLRLTCLYT